MVLLVGGLSVLQPQMVDLAGLCARVAASLGRRVDRGWAVATNVRTLARPTEEPPQWDAVDAIHRLLATKEYPHHNQDCGRVLVYTQQVPAGFGAQVCACRAAVVPACACAYVHPCLIVVSDRPLIKSRR